MNPVCFINEATQILAQHIGLEPTKYPQYFNQTPKSHKFHKPSLSKSIVTLTRDAVGKCTSVLKYPIRNILKSRIRGDGFYIYVRAHTHITGLIFRGSISL